jgi:hypothetical protein
MTDRFYSVALGDKTPSAVTEGAATSSEAIELRVEYDATGVDKRSVLVGLDIIKARILQDTWPPA